MPSSRGKKVAASRRRREDEGEEEGSVAGELEDDSLSEGSIISNGDDDADVEPSDVSEEDVVQAQRNQGGPPQPDPALTTTTHNLEESSAKAIGSKFFTSSDTKAMMNGLKVPEGKGISAVDFDQEVAETMDPVDESSMLQTKTSVEPPAERSRREHLEYLKEKKENPAFVPNRGGFFLHDNRATSSGLNGFRAPGRGRGRGGFIGFQARYYSSPVSPFEFIISLHAAEYHLLLSQQTSHGPMTYTSQSQPRIPRSQLQARSWTMLNPKHLPLYAARAKTRQTDHSPTLSCLERSQLLYIYLACRRK